MKKSKVMSLKEAAAQVENGSLIKFSGILDGKKPWAFCFELIRQRKENIILHGEICLGEDAMVGAGCVKGYLGGYTAMGLFGLAPCFRRAVERQEIALHELGHLEVVGGLAAGALGAAGVVTRYSFGTDIHNPAYWGLDKLRAIAKDKNKIPRAGYILIDDPFWEGGKYAVTPATRLDYYVLHAQEAGEEGTVRLEGCLGVDIGVRAADKVIVTAERIVPEEYLRREPNKNQFSCLDVDIVVEVPWGGHPGSVYGCYDYDLEFFREYAAKAKSESGFREWLEEWVYGVKDHDGYVKKLGYEKLKKLKVTNPLLGYVPWKELVQHE